MAPLEFIQRLAALVPRRRLHLIRFHGVLAPNAKLRREIIPTPPEPATAPGCAAIRSIPNGLRAQTDCQRKPTAPLALSSSERRDPEHCTLVRPLHRPSHPKQHRDFH
jgi:hypothetical protein